MKRITLIILLGVLLLGVVSAGLFDGLFGDTIKPLKVKQIETTTTLPVGDVRLNNTVVSELNCDDSVCSFWITGNEINTQQFIDYKKTICNEGRVFNQTTNQTMITKNCVDTIKTNDMLMAERDSIVKDKVNYVADDIQKRASKNNTKIDDGYKVELVKK